MKISFFLLFTLLICSQSWAAQMPSVIEHQIRICDSEKNILEKLSLKSSEGKKRDVLYIETPDQYYRNNGWVIRLKVKSSTVIVDIKKRFRRTDIVPMIKDMECEYDKHGPSVEKTCKLSSEISLNAATSIINHKKTWTNILSLAQKNWMESESAIRAEANFNGILKDVRYEIEHPSLGTITLDTVQLDSDKSITYHEISMRYNENEEAKTSVMFDSFIRSKNLLLCPDQLDWAINKFDVMSILEHY